MINDPIVNWLRLLLHDRRNGVDLVAVRRITALHAEGAKLDNAHSHALGRLRGVFTVRRSSLPM